MGSQSNGGEIPPAATVTSTEVEMNRREFLTWAASAGIAVPIVASLGGVRRAFAESRRFPACTARLDSANVSGRVRSGRAGMRASFGVGARRCARVVDKQIVAYCVSST